MSAVIDAASAAQIERDCTRLVLLFAEYVDSGNYEGLRELFAADGAFYRPAEPERAFSVAEVIDSYRQRLTPLSAMHLVTNILITPQSATEATGSARILFYAAPIDAPQEVASGRQATMQLVGRFTDRFVLTGQGWRFAQRRGGMLFHR